MDRLQRLASKYFQQQCSALPQLLNRWDETLKDFGGDLCRTNWNDFRPLRLSREEDWSDWLAYLLQNAQAAEFADALFPELELAAQPYQAPKVIREEATTDYRADLVIQWNGASMTHLEVKLWDLNFQKIFPTSLELCKKFANQATGFSWSNYILIPSESEEPWLECKEAASSGVSIQEITWDTIALALRQALMRRKEKLQWLTAAYNFCGAIEQKILGIPRLSADLGTLPLNNQGEISRLADLLKRGLDT